MAKRVTSRKRTVMQDVHPDVADRIEKFTDPDRIEAARTRLVDYSKVAEQFAASSDLPEEDDDVDGLPGIVPVAAPATPAAAAASADDLDLLATLEQDDEPAPAEAPAITDLNDDDGLGDLDDSDFESFLNDDVPAKVPAQPILADKDPLDDFDMSDLDTDLMDDSGADDSQVGDSAFGAPDSDDDDIFGVGIPSAVQEPTPFGNKAAKAAKDADDEYDFPFDDEIGADPAPAAKERAVPTWMVEDDDDDAPDVLSALNRRAAETDGDADAGIFDDADLSEEETRTTRRTVRTPTSTASLDDVMGLDDEDETSDRSAEFSAAGLSAGEPVVPNAAPEEQAEVVIEETVKKKRSFFPSFGRKKKSNVRVHEEPVATVAAVDTGLADTADAEVIAIADPAPKPQKRGFFGKKKVIKQDAVIEQDVLGDEKETVITTTETEDGDGVNVVTDTEIRKKRNPFLRMAASVVAIAAVLGGGYYVADTMGFFPQPTQPQVVTPVTGPLVDSTDSPADTAIAVIDEDVTALPSTEEPAVAVGSTDGTAAVSQTVTNPDGSTTTTMSVPLNADPAPAVGVLALPDLGDIESPVDEPEAAVVVTTETPEDAATVATVEVDDPADISALDDLYSAGKSETDLAAVDEAVTLDRVLELSTLLEAQKSSLDSALERLRTLETVIADKDAVIAAAQTEANEAQAAAAQARDMAMAQNNVLIEVVGIQDKMKIAEELIVDLSKRTAAIESDNTDIQQIEYLNERIKDLTTHMALLSRTVVNNGQNLRNAQSAQAAADRAYTEAQAAVDAQAQATMDAQTQPAPAGSSGVYGNEQRLMTTPTLQDGVEIPADVKVGDELPVYGKVLDISPTEDGGRLIVMENSSKIIPRQE